jgi:hypothetical protein
VVEWPSALLVMRNFPQSWYVAGGWAIDLFLGRVTRHHEDAEVALFRKDQSHLRAYLEGWRFEIVRNGKREPWPEGELLELPVHEIHARESGDRGTKLEFLLNERSGDSWVYRRKPAVTMRVDEIGGFTDGLPYLRPEIVLLYKSKSPRPVDELDFRAVLGALDRKSAKWLADSLEECSPGHRWLDHLTGGR